MTAVSIFYGSQTGAAESIAQRIYEEANDKELDASLHPLNDFQKSKVLETEGHHVIIVTSTTGNGDPPDNADRFWRFAKRRSQPKDLFANLHFTVLGLGDTNYDRFCHMGKSINRRIAELGGHRFYDMAAADEAMGLEETVEPWLDGLWDAFDKSIGTVKATSDAAGNDDATSDDISSSDATTNNTTTASSMATLPPNLQTYDMLFGASTSTEAPTDVPRLQKPLVTVRFSEKSTEAETPGNTSEIQEYSLEHPYTARITNAEYLTTETSSRKVLGVEIDVSGSEMAYKPGDAIAIKCPNRSDEVDGLLHRLGLKGQTWCGVEGTKSSSRKASPADRFPSHCSLRDLFLHHVDIRSSPKKGALRTLATFCLNEEEKARLLLLSSKAGADKYKTMVTDQQLTFLEVLLLFRSCSPPLDTVLSLLPQLMPRYYSVASSPLGPRGSDRMYIALTIVKEEINDKGLVRHGLCTNWLHDLCQPLLTGSTVPSPLEVQVFMRPSHDFSLPASHKWPLILIGPGTGVAPFIGFLEHRYYELQRHNEEPSEVSTGFWRGGFEVQLQDDPEYRYAPALEKSKDGNLLFFGCRHKDEDWIFKPQMHQAMENGTLSSLFTAFSRDQEEKHYVQHDLRTNGKLVCDLLLESNGYVFVCGDGMDMAKDVHEALADVLETHGHMTKEEAKEKLTELMTRQRYVRDIW